MTPARNTAALMLAAIVGAAAGRASAPVRDPIVQTDPLGGWHYAEFPVRICTAQDGAGAARVVVRPEIITTAGVRVSVPEFRVGGPEWFACHSTAAELARSTFPAQDVCYTRGAEGLVEVDIEGRDVGPAAAFLACQLDALRAVVAANPIAGPPAGAVP